MVTERDVALELQDSVASGALGAEPLTSAEGTRCSVEPSRFAAHQATTKHLFSRILKRGSSDRGLLVWHTTGAGKTATATGAMDAAWPTSRKIVYVTNAQALAANPPSTFHGFARHLLPRFKGRSQAAVEAAFQRRGVEFTTFARLAHHLQLYRPRKPKDAEQKEQWRNHLGDALLIVDEAHTLLKPSTDGFGAEHAALAKLLSDPRDRALQGTVVVLMTATPGDDTESVMRLVNMVRRADAGPVAWTGDSSTLARDVQGLISFFDASADPTRFPKRSTRTHVAPMSVPQALAVQKAASGKQQPPGGTHRLRELTAAGKGGSYWRLARAYTNTMFKRASGTPLAEFSSKLALLTATIARYPDHKHYVYSQYHERRGYGGHGAHAIVRALVQDRGYVSFPKQGSRVVALLDSAQSAGDAVPAFNAASNDTGADIHVLVATRRFNEGVDLKAVRHVHVFEPMLEPSADEQVVGRAVRFCSHTRLDKSDWTVEVHRYASAPPDVTRQAAVVAEQVGRAQGEVQRVRGELALLKGVRGGPGVANRRSRLRTFEKTLETDVRVAKAESARLSKAASAPNVDKVVEDTVREAGRDVKSLLRALRSAAVDCPAFEAFHRAGGVGVPCASHVRSGEPAVRGGRGR